MSGEKIKLILYWGGLAVYRESESIDTQFLKVPTHILCHLLGQAERVLWK